MAPRRVSSPSGGRSGRKATSAATKALRAARKARMGLRRDPGYLRWIRGLACEGCGEYGVDPHHEPPRSHGDWHDHRTVPLCRECHDLRHRLGARDFWLLQKCCPDTLTGSLRAQYLREHEDGEPPF